MKKIIHVGVERNMLEDALMDYLLRKGKIPKTALYFSEISLVLLRDKSVVFLSNLDAIDLDVIIDEDDEEV